MTRSCEVRLPRCDLLHVLLQQLVELLLLLHSTLIFCFLTWTQLAHFHRLLLFLVVRHHHSQIRVQRWRRRARWQHRS
jgi:hypothetical protein